MLDSLKRAFGSILVNEPIVPIVIEVFFLSLCDFFLESKIKVFRSKF